MTTVQNLLNVLATTLGTAAESNPAAKLGLTAAAALASILDNRFGAGARDIVVEKPADITDEEWAGLKEHPIMNPNVVDDTFNAALKAERAANPEPPLPPGPSYHPSPSYVGPSYVSPSYPGPSHPGPSHS